MKTAKKHPFDEVVYLLQGGGALGSYQVGVCEALFSFGCEPDWLVGTSIGGINAAIIAGNKPEKRIQKLNQFWEMISARLPTFPFHEHFFYLQRWQNFCQAQWILWNGQPGFFKPRSWNLCAMSPQTPDQISFYEIDELADTLEKVIDFDLINSCKVRLTLESINIRNGAHTKFDNFRQTIDARHVMASCALSPGFPAIKIDEEYYWDGGMSSNTPFSIILEEKIDKKLLCVIVNLFAYPNHLPSDMMDVVKTKKELEYVSHHQEVLNSFLELHFLQNTIASLAKTAVHDQSVDKALQKIAKTGHPLSLNILRFHYADKPTDLWSKDFNFSRNLIEQHQHCGYLDAQKAIQSPSWLDLKVGPTGAVIHEF